MSHLYDTAEGENGSQSSVASWMYQELEDEEWELDLAAKMLVKTRTFPIGVTGFSSWFQLHLQLPVKADPGRQQEWMSSQVSATHVGGIEPMNEHSVSVYMSVWPFKKKI